MADDFASAIAEAQTELGGGDSTPEPDSTPEAAAPEAAPEAKPEKEAAPAPKAEATPAQEEEEFYNPTAEELAAIEASPALKKAYRSLRKGFTTKTTELANIRKDLQERAALADWVQQNPEKAARALAEHAGLSIAEARQEIKQQTAATAAADDLEAEWAAAIGKDAAAVLRPLIEKTVNKRLGSDIEPLRQQTQELAQAAQARGIAASIREFGAARIEGGDEWTDEIQQEMAKESQRVRPGDDTPIGEYMDTLYHAVQARRARTARTRDNINRLKRIREEQEPVTTGRAAASAEETITTDMNDNDAIAIAVRQARKAAGIR